MNNYAYHALATSLYRFSGDEIELTTDNIPIYGDYEKKEVYYGSTCLRLTAVRNIVLHVSEALFLISISVLRFPFVPKLLGYAYETNNGAYELTQENARSLSLYFEPLDHTSYPLYLLDDKIPNAHHFYDQLLEAWIIVRRYIYSLFNSGLIYSNYSRLNIIWNGTQWILFNFTNALKYETETYYTTRSPAFYSMYGWNPLIKVKLDKRNNCPYINILYPEIYGLAISIVKMLMKKHYNRGGAIADYETWKFAQECLLSLDQEWIDGTYPTEQYKYAPFRDVLELIADRDYAHWGVKIARYGW